MNGASEKNVLLIVEGAKREPQLMGRLFESLASRMIIKLFLSRSMFMTFLISSFKNTVAISSPLILSPLSLSFFRIKMMRLSFSNPVLQTPCSYLT